MKKLILLFAVAFNLNSNEFLTGSLVDYSGLIKMPNARFNNEGKVSFNYSRFDPYGKYVFKFSHMIGLRELYFIQISIH